MAQIKLPYLMMDFDRHGNRRYYFRRYGKKIRLNGALGSAEFMAAYAAAEKGGRTPPPSKADPKSVRALLEGYYRSAQFKSLNERSRRTRMGILEAWAKGKDHLPFRQIQRRHILKWRDEKVEKPGAATNLLKALRHVFSFAVDYGMMHQNPAREVRYLKRTGTGFHTWTIEEVQIFEARHPVGTKPRLALALLLYTGQRRSDVVTFGKQMIRDGRLHYNQKKTGKRMATAIIEPLSRIIEATPTSGLTFLETQFGLPYTPAGFGNAFREWCNEAGLHHCTAHGLRKAMAARLAELGATASQIQGVLGHDTLAQASLYTREADGMISSDAALELFENTIAPPLARGETKRAKLP